MAYFRLSAGAVLAALFLATAGVGEVCAGVVPAPAFAAPATPVGSAPAAAPGRCTRSQAGGWLNSR